MTTTGRRLTTVCRACPVRHVDVGEFDVANRPNLSTWFDRDRGHRIIPESGIPVCVHPDRIGLSPDAYASAGTPLPRLSRLLLKFRLAATIGSRSSRTH